MIGPGEVPVQLNVNGKRIETHLIKLAKYGLNRQGGTSRVAYTDADLQGRDYAIQLMKDAGLDVHIDAAGNIFALRPGTNGTLPPVLFGSHIDSVPNGGNFDGDLGTLAAIEVVQTLNEAQVTLRRGLEIVVWQNEEGYAFNNGLAGSRAAAQRALRRGAALLEAHAPDAVVRGAGGAVEAYEDAIKDGRPGSHADFDLHYVIAEATRNRFFVSVMTSLRDHIVFGMNLSRDLSRMKPAARLKAVREEHRRVFDAIRARDPERAYEAMRVHVEEARFRIFEGGTKPVASAIGTDQRVPHDVPEA